MTQQETDFIIASIANISRDMQKIHATNEILLELIAEKLEIDIKTLRFDIGKIEAELIYQQEKIWAETLKNIYRPDFPQS
jgi:hypothetical protein